MHCHKNAHKIDVQPAINMVDKISWNSNEDYHHCILLALNGLRKQCFQSTRLCFVYNFDYNGVESINDHMIVLSIPNLT